MYYRYSITIKPSLFRCSELFDHTSLKEDISVHCGDCYIAWCKQRCIMMDCYKQHCIIRDCYKGRKTNAAAEWRIDATPHCTLVRCNLIPLYSVALASCNLIPLCTALNRDVLQYALSNASHCYALYCSTYYCTVLRHMIWIAVYPIDNSMHWNSYHRCSKSYSALLPNVLHELVL